MTKFGNNRDRASRAQRILIFGALVLLGVLIIAGRPLAWSTTNAVAVAGEIQDSACAGTAAHVEKECAQRCVRNGAKWVLYDPSTAEVYQLDDQKQPAVFAAQKVVVIGKLDRSTRTIHVAKITGA